MGNRAVISFSERKSAPSIYLHWNGGRASVEGLARGDFDYNDEETVRRYAAMTADEFVAHCRASRVEAVLKAKARGAYDLFLAPSWTSRRDLAEKEAARLRNSGRLEATILEAKVK